MAQREEPIWRVADMGLVIGCERVTTKPTSEHGHGKLEGVE